MKILLVGPAGKNNRTEFYIRRAFTRLGHRVVWFNHNKLSRLIGKRAGSMLERFCSLVNPDFVLFFNDSRLDPAVAGRIAHGRDSAVWYFDARTEFPPHLIDIARESKTLFLTNKHQIPFLREQGIPRVYFLPQACDASLHRYVTPKHGPRYQASFIGRVEKNPYRFPLLSRLGEEVDLHVWGKPNRRTDCSYTTHSRALFNRSLARVIGESTVTLGINYDEAFNSFTAYASNRVWLTLGCGGFFMAYRTPGMQDVVPENRYCVYYDSFDELKETIRYYTKNPDKRESIRRAGYHWCHSYHTFEHRIPHLLTRTPFPRSRDQ